MIGTRFWASIIILYSCSVFVSSQALANEKGLDCAGIKVISQTLGYELKNLNKNLVEVITDEGSIYLKESPSTCSYMLMLVFDNKAAFADLDFVNKQNVNSRFGFLTLQDDKLIFENHILMPKENKFLFKAYFRMFKTEADRINQELQAIVKARIKFDEQTQHLAPAPSV